MLKTVVLLNISRLRLHLNCIVQVTQFRFYSPMWHRSDMAHDHVSRKKSHGFRYSQIGFRPHSYVEINPIWIGYVHLRLPCKWSDRILPCKCDSYVIEMCVFVTFRGTDIPVTWNISNWVAEYNFFPFVLNKRRSDAEMYCFWNHAECSLLLSVMTAHAQTSASVPFVPLKPQNKMHTNMSLPLIYNHWWTHSVLITKKKQNMWHAWQYLPPIIPLIIPSIIPLKLSAELKTSLSWIISSRLYHYFDV